jgi:hypothetical protein
LINLSAEEKLAGLERVAETEDNGTAELNGEALGTAAVDAPGDAPLDDIGDDAPEPGVDGGEEGGGSEDTPRPASDNDSEE